MDHLTCVEYVFDLRSTTAGGDVLFGPTPAESPAFMLEASVKQQRNNMCYEQLLLNVQT